MAAMTPPDIPAGSLVPTCLREWVRTCHSFHTETWAQWRDDTEAALVEYGQYIHVRVTQTELAQLREWLALQGEHVGAEVARRVVEAAGKHQ
jgi:hypothetical protein